MKLKQVMMFVVASVLFVAAASNVYALEVTPQVQKAITDAVDSQDSNQALHLSPQVQKAITDAVDSQDSNQALHLSPQVQKAIIDAVNSKDSNNSGDNPPVDNGNSGVNNNDNAGNKEGITLGGGSPADATDIGSTPAASGCQLSFQKSIPTNFNLLLLLIPFSMLLLKRKVLSR